MSQRLYPAGAPPSLWVTEGLAGYFGFTFQDSSGKFRPGEVGGKSTVVVRDTPSRPGRTGAQRIKQFRQTLKDSEDEPGELIYKVISIQSPDAFYGEDSPFNYAASWMLVHWLMHAQDGRFREPFLEYLKWEAEQGPDPEVLTAKLGMTPAELGTAVANYTKRVKSR